MRLCFCLFLLVGSVSLSAEDDSARRQRGLELFESKIRPVLVEHCYECHSEESGEASGGLQVDSRGALRGGGDSGPALTPGKPEQSVLLSAIAYEDFEMPPDQQLPASVVKDFRRWIALGAPDPRGGDQPQPTAAEPPTSSSELWSLQPIEEVEPPTVPDPTWAETTIDRFILSRLAEEGIEPVGDAKPADLLRRLSFDLVGLPPDPETIRAFVADPSRAHYDEIVDRLLDSPRFGERWARHWLDVVRYGESAGSSRDVLMLYSWRYRDYVIDAFNQDLPYDQFVAEQIAGDLMPADTDADRKRKQIATGLLAIGSKSLNGGNLQLDIVDDQIDVIGKAILGLTVSCARCHDHKYDPIPTADYYALAGIFKSTETFYGGNTKRPKNTKDKLDVYLPLGGPVDPEAVAASEQRAKKIQQLEKQWRKLQQQSGKLRAALGKDFDKQERELEQKRDAGETLDKDEAKLLEQIAEFRNVAARWRALKAEADELRKVPAPSYEFAFGVTEAKKTVDSPIHVRGERRNTGDIVPRGFLSCVASLGEEYPVPEDQSGRLQLARWLTDPDQPLTPRVAVNRVWQHLFGQGLVSTPANFGVNGARPSHPQLLDYLADRFTGELQWSRKRLIKEIVSSRAYRLATDFDKKSYAADPENRLRWRMDRRRLEAEPLRDAILLAGGTLDLQPPAGSAVMEVGEGEFGRNINMKPLDRPKNYRSIYLPIVRGYVPEPLKLFDFPEPSNPQGIRDSSNVPAQSLYLMNNPRVIEQARSLGESVADNEATAAEKVETIFLRCLSRFPTEKETESAIEFVNRTRKPDGDSENSLGGWPLLAHSLFASAEFRYLD